MFDRTRIRRFFQTLHAQRHDEELIDKSFGLAPPPVNIQSIAAGSMIMYAHTDGLLYEATVVEITGEPGTRKFKLHFPVSDAVKDRKNGRSKL